MSEGGGMTAEEMRQAARAGSVPPDGLDLALRALWWAAGGDWTRAHETAQQGEDAASAWVHAWLHRQEGDLSNADYWYRRAGRRRMEGPLDAEWTAIAEALLARG